MLGTLVQIANTMSGDAMLHSPVNLLGHFTILLAALFTIDWLHLTVFERWSNTQFT